MTQSSALTSNTDETLLEELLTRKRARNNLLTFVEYVHPSWETGEHHGLICEWLERLDRHAVCPFCGIAVTRLAIHAPPRHSKTALVTHFAAWYLGRHPTREIICGSATDDLAKTSGRNVREIVRDTRFKNIFKDVDLQADAQAAGRWLTNHGGVFFSVGVGATGVGRGAHLAIIDDPHGGRDKADSEVDRNRVGTWFYGTVLFRLMRPGSILLDMTKWHEDDLAGRILPNREAWRQTDKLGRTFCCGDWHVITLRAIEFEGTDHEQALWPGKEVPDPKAERLAGFPLKHLQQLRNDLISHGKEREWRSQYQQDAVIEGGTYIKREWYTERYDPRKQRIIDARHQGSNYSHIGLPEDLRIYMASDFAVSAPRDDSKDPDYTVHGVFGIGPDDRLYILDWWREQTTPDIWIDRLIDLFAKWDPIAWFGEAGGIRRAIESVLQRRMRERGIYTSLYWVTSDKDKSARGRAFQAWSASGRVIFPIDNATPEFNWVPVVVNICVGFPTAAHDDDFDVMGTMCRVVDETHPAILPALPEKVPDRDIWAINEPSSDGWRLV